MELVETSQRSGKTLAVIIINSYNKYVEYGYPKDTSVYVIKANRKTLEEINKYFSSFEPPIKFNTFTENDFKDRKVVFGPEQVIISWKNENGL